MKKKIRTWNEIAFGMRVGFWFHSKVYSYSPNRLCTRLCNTEDGQKEKSFWGGIKFTFLFVLYSLSICTMTYAGPVEDLFSVAIRGNGKRVDAILASGVDVNAVTATGRTALMGAASYGNLRIARKLIAYGADINLADRQRKTALMDAIASGNVGLVKLLIGSGANVNQADRFGSLILVQAKRKGDKHIIKLLEDAGAKAPEPEPKPEEVDTESKKDSKK